MRLELVCGYLGAGKTTWLSHRLLDAAEPLAALVVNDFADVGTDAHALRTTLTRRMHSVSGGCICCDRRHELAAILHGEIGRAHARPTDAPAETVVVEASGVARAEPILRLVREDPVLHASISDLRVTAVVDGLDGLRLLRHRGEVREQIRSADHVVLTRADLADESELDRLASFVGTLSPGATLATSDQGRERGWTRATAPAEPLPELAALEADYRSWVRPVPNTVRWSEIALWVHAVTRAHPDELVRMKGTVRTDRATVTIHTMGRVVDVRRAAEHSGPAGTLTAVLSGLEPEALEASFAAWVPSASM